MLRIVNSAELFQGTLGKYRRQFFDIEDYRQINRFKSII